ncbi:MAG: glycosyltransferase family 4 protein [Chitinophagaceae bacterium]|nr:glycosyltransferase family 4 protein [Chitinophagaceae bacterium]
MNIILDCDLMKYPNSGLYHYCLNLGQTVHSQLKQGESLAFYGWDNVKEGFGRGYKVIKERKGLFRNYRPFLKNCDIWHAPFQSGRVVPEPSHYPGMKILLTIHDLNVLHEGKPISEQQKSITHTQSLIDRSHALVCISEFCRQDVLQHCKVGNKPVFVIHNGTHKVGSPDLSKNSYRPSRPFLFGMGYINRKKNYHVLVPLLKNEEIEMVLAGRLDEPDYVDQILQNAKSLGVGDRLHLPGPVSEEEKSWYLKNCLAFVHPSLAEGFGAPVVEAMQFGRPLFLSNLTSLPEIAGETAFYFENFEDAYLQEVFKKGMDNFRLNGLSEKIKQKGSEYDWKIKGKQYLELYRELSLI